MLNSRALTFDSRTQQIKPKHILGTSAYPLYNFPWLEIEIDVYAWNGGLFSNTPLREVLDASPILDKIIFLVENYPKKKLINYHQIWEKFFIVRETSNSQIRLKIT